MKRLKLKWLWLSIGYAMVVFVIYSSLSKSPMSPGVEVSDKLLHFMAYFGLMAWFVQIYQKPKVRYLLLLLLIVMGVLLEYLQALGGVRYFEFNDMLANSAGAIFAWALSYSSLFSSVLYRYENYFICAERKLD